MSRPVHIVSPDFSQRAAIAQRAYADIRPTLRASFGPHWTLRAGVLPLERCPDDPRHLALRIWLVCSPETLFGLRGWRDALDGVWQDPNTGVCVHWSVWEIAKALRMSTRQSFEALSMMASHPLPFTLPFVRPWGEMLHSLFGRTIHQGAVHTLRAVASSMALDTSPQAHLQLTLSSHVLAVAHTLQLHHTPDEREVLWSRFFPKRPSLEDILSTPPEMHNLPTSPPGYEDLHGFLQRLRRASIRWG